MQFSRVFLRVILGIAIVITIPSSSGVSLRSGCESGYCRSKVCQENCCGGTVYYNHKEFKPSFLAATEYDHWFVLKNCPSSSCEESYYQSRCGNTSCVEIE